MEFFEKVNKLLNKVDLTNIIYLKAFDKVPHQRLLSLAFIGEEKGSFYGLKVG